MQLAETFGMQLGGEEGEEEEEGEGQEENKGEGGREEARNKEDRLNYNLQL